MSSPATPKRKQVKVNSLSYAQLIKAMIPGDLTCQELADETGLHLVTVYQYARDLHAARAAHIARFDPDVRGRHTVKVYKLGAGKDAPRVRMTGAQRQARSRANRKAHELARVVGGSARYVQAANGRLRFEEAA